MRFAVVAHRSTETNVALVQAAERLGLDAELLEPRDALLALGAGDVALARLDVREGLDGMESGTPELERLADAGVEVLNPPRALIAAHDKLLTARALRFAALPHPHTSLIAAGIPSTAPDLPVVLKPRFGSWGRDVVLCRTAADLDAALENLAFRDWFQEHGALAQELVPPPWAEPAKADTSQGRGHAPSSSSMSAPRPGTFASWWPGTGWSAARCASRRRASGGRTSRSAGGASGPRRRRSPGRSRSRQRPRSAATWSASTCSPPAPGSSSPS
jgi:hypothetical protein